MKRLLLLLTTALIAIVSFSETVKTVTVFKATEQSDHYANQAVLAAFKGRLYCVTIVRL